jgi:Na+-driven multidrug efflux pump
VLVSLPVALAGVFAAITIAESLVTVVSVMLFRRGRWKTRMV